MPIIFDRSRRETDERCPRQRFLQYEADGMGYERKPTSFPLLTGSLVHQPLSEALLLAKKSEFVPSPYEVNALTANAKAAYMAAVVERGILSDVFDGDDELVGKTVTSPNWQVEEQVALLEMLVKGWIRVRLPAILAEYEILDTEREERLDLTPDLTMLTRSDATLRRRHDGAIFVLNFKTTSKPDHNWLEQWRYDQQTLSEVLPIEVRLGMTLSGVLIEGLVKGQRNIQWPRDAGQWRHNTALLYAYKKDEGAPFPPAYATKYDYTCTDPHPFGKGRSCPGGAKHTLSRDWQRTMMAQEPGMTADLWLDWLAENEPETLRASFINLPAIMRSPYEIERWRRSAIQRESEIARLAGWVNEIATTSGDALAVDRELDKAFPQHSSHGNCIRPSRCAYLDVCWGSHDIGDTDFYTPRRANHPDETSLRGRVGAGIAHAKVDVEVEG